MWDTLLDEIGALSSNKRLWLRPQTAALLGINATMDAGVRSVFTQGLVSLKMDVALDADAERPSISKRP
jgi:hypothetical protein